MWQGWLCKESGRYGRSLLSLFVSGRVFVAQAITWPGLTVRVDYLKKALPWQGCYNEDIEKPTRDLLHLFSCHSIDVAFGLADSAAISSNRLVST